MTTSTVKSTTIGHVIGAMFGLAFVIANSSPLPHPVRIVLIVTAIAIVILTVVSFARAAARHTRPDGESFGNSYWLVVVFEALALFGGLALLNHWQPSANVAWIAVVVGIHFFVLARLWASGSSEIVVIAVAMTALGAAGLIIAFTADSQDAVALVSGVGSGVVLLASSLSAAVRGH